MKSRKTIFGLFTCTLVWLVLMSGTVRCEVIDRTVATVNGEIILYSDLQEQMKVMEMVAPEVKTAAPEKRAAIERDVLQQIIRQKLTEQEAKRLKVAVTPGEVDRAIDDVKKENHFTDAQFEASLKKSDMSMAKFRDGIKKELERNRLLERVLRMKTVITEQQIDAYLKEKPAGSAAPRESARGAVKGVRLAVIYLPMDPKKGNAQEVEKTGRDILGKIKGGADFGKMARQYSKGPAAAEGGDVGLMTPDEIAPYVASAIKGLSKDQVSELIKGPEGFYIVKVLGFEEKQSEPGQVAKADSNPRERARRELYNKELERRFNEWVQSLESKAFIQISL